MTNTNHNSYSNLNMGGGNSMESFIEYCDKMMIATEGIIKNKWEDFKTKKRVENDARIEKIRKAIPVIKRIAGEFKKAVTKLGGKIVKEDFHQFDPKDYDSDFFQIDVHFKMMDTADKNELYRELAAIRRNYSKEFEECEIWIDGHAFKKDNVFSICTTGDKGIRGNKKIDLVIESMRRW